MSSIQGTFVESIKMDRQSDFLYQEEKGWLWNVFRLKIKDLKEGVFIVSFTLLCVHNYWGKRWSAIWTLKVPTFFTVPPKSASQLQIKKPQAQWIWTFEALNLGKSSFVKRNAHLILRELSFVTRRGSVCMGGGPEFFGVVKGGTRCKGGGQKKIGNQPSQTDGPPRGKKWQLPYSQIVLIWVPFTE